MYRSKLEKLVNDGILLVDKQAGKTSYDEIRAITNVLSRHNIETKIGHSGTLDPKVTGLLVLGLGDGTKVLEYMLESEKVYIGELVIHKPIKRITLEESIKKFTGAISQLPPQKSSVKRIIRTRNIYNLQILSFHEDEKIATIYCAVEKGTYIRKLFHDIGQDIGVGAHMGDLHRIAVGPFRMPAMISTDRFETLINKILKSNSINAFFAYHELKRYLFPKDSAIQQYPAVHISKDVVKNIVSGNDVYVPGVVSIPQAAELGDLVTIKARSQIIAIGELMMNKSDFKGASRGIVVNTKKVLVSKLDIRK